MSDIEDYAYSPYDNLEDILYDADPAPELADELADHAIHSPIYHDEDLVKNELDDYFSDWEYYSDDYLDDDPTLLKENPQDGTPPKPRKLKRGKKRKLAETQDIPPSHLDEDLLLTRCIKGTIWAKPSELKTPPYTDGQEKKVALMKDWKQAFAVKDNGWRRSTTQGEDDESWAKDMSLADMGLQNLPRQASFEQETQQAEPEFEEDDEDNLDEAYAEHEDKTLSSPEDIPESPSVNHRHNLPTEENDRGGKDYITVVQKSSDADETDVPRKKRRIKPALPSPPDSNEAVGVDLPAEQEQVSSAKMEDLTISNKKRKASEEPEDGAKSATTGRAKRVASSVTTTAAASRPTRKSRAK